MADEDGSPAIESLVRRLGAFQVEYGGEVLDVERESPAAALDSLETAVQAAPADYRTYLEESVECYRWGLYRGAILLVWAAVVQHLYAAAGSRRGGVAEFEKANKARFGEARTYRRIRRQNDFLYLKEDSFLVLAEDAGMLNRNARHVLQERLKLRNLCGHPTLYQPGREETVIFVESLLLNVLSGSWLNW